MITVEFTTRSPLYQRTLGLRDLHLRQPLGLRLTDQDTAGEEDQRHFALLMDEEIIGGLIIRLQPPHSAVIRQMWIAPAHGGQGCGRQLITSAETILAGEGITTLLLHARKSAQEFYQRCGYHSQGDSFIEVGIPHTTMSKDLTSTPPIHPTDPGRP